METEILTEENSVAVSAHKSASDKIIEEILLNENQNDYDVLQSKDDGTEEQRENMIPLSIVGEECNGLGDTSSLRVNCLDVLQEVPAVDKHIIEGDVQFRIINCSDKGEDEVSAQPLPPVDLEQHPTDNVGLDAESSDLTGIDELETYADGNNVLIPKLEDIGALNQASVSADQEEDTTVTSISTETSLIVQDDVHQSTQQISLPVSNTAATINPAIVGMAELDGNIVSIGGQHFILFTGVSQTNPVMNEVTTVVSEGTDSTDVVYEPAHKKAKTEDSLIPSAVTELDTGIENLVGFHSPQQHVIEVVEEEKDKGEQEVEGPTDITQAWFTTRDDKYKLQSKGSTWKQGQWSKDEIELLQSNINNYCQAHNIVDPTEVIFEMSKDERKNFYRTIAVGLNRPLFSVYRRVIRMYDQKNHIGRYSHEELQKLKELRKRLGTDWAAIGAELGRSASSVKDRCRLMKDQCYTGKWLPEEENRLTNAVYRLTGAMPGVDVTVGLSWAAVAEQVGTRTEKQCRTKWLNYLNWKQRGGTEWTRVDDLSLIEKIASLNVADETHINWEQLSKDWTSVRSPQWLRGKWWSLKRTIPDYQLLSFSVIINTLKTNSKNLLRGGTRSETSVPYSVKMDPPAPTVLQQQLQLQQLSQKQQQLQQASGTVTMDTTTLPQDDGESESEAAVISSQQQSVNQYIITAAPQSGYELTLSIPIQQQTTEENDKTDRLESVIANQSQLVQQESEVIEVDQVSTGKQPSVIAYSESGDSPQSFVLTYPVTEESSSESPGITSQQQNPMMSSAFKSESLL